MASRSISTRFNLEGEGAYKNAIQQITQEQKNLNQELRLVDERMKRNGESQEGLKSKSVLLEKQVSLQKERLAELNKEMQELNEKYPEGGKQVDAHAGKIKAAEVFLEKYQGELENVQSKLKNAGSGMKDFGDKLEKGGQKAQEIGKGMSTWITLPIAGIATAAMAAWTEYDDAIDGIITATGASGDALADLEQVYRNVFTNLPVESEKVGSAIGELNTQFGFAGDELENATDKMVKFSEITGSDVVSATQGAKGIIEAYGLEYADLESVLDDVAKASQDTGAGTDALMASMQKYAPQIETLGLGVGEAAQMLGQMEQKGLDASAVLGGLAKAQADGAKDGKSLNAVLDEFRGLAESGASETELMGAAAEIFGTRRGPMMYKALQQGVLDFDNLASAAQGATGTVTDTFEATLDPIDKAKVALNNVKVAGADLGAAIQVGATPILEGLADTAKNLAEWFSGLDDGTKELLIKIGGIAAVSGPAISAFGKISEKAGNLIGKFAEAKESGKSFGELLGGGGKAGLVALAALGTVALIKYRESLREIRDEAKAAIDSAEQSAAAFEDAMSDIGGNDARVAELTDTLYELAGQSNLTAEEQGKMQAIISELNKIVPDLNLAYDEQTGSLNLTQEAVLGLSDAYKRQAELQAYEERANELRKEGIQLAEEKRIQEELLKEEVEKGNLKWNEQAQAYEHVHDGLRRNLDYIDSPGLMNSLDGMLNTWNGLTDAQSKNVESLEEAEGKVEEIYTSQAEAAQKSGDTIQKSAQETAAAQAEALEQTIALQGEYLDSLAKINETDLKMDEWSVMGLSEVWQEELASLVDYQEGLASARERVSEDYYNWLTSMGTDGAALVKDINTSTDEALQENVRIWQLRNDVTLALAEEGAGSLEEVMISGYEGTNKKTKELFDEFMVDMKAFTENRKLELDRRNTLEADAIELGLNEKQLEKMEIDEIFDAMYEAHVKNTEKTIAEAERELEEIKKRNLKKWDEYRAHQEALTSLSDQYLDATLKNGEEEVSLTGKTADEVLAINKKRVEDLKKTLEDQINYNKNVGELAAKVPEDVMRELKRLGPEGAPLIAEYNEMTQEELDKNVGVWEEMLSLSMSTAEEELGVLPDVVLESTSEAEQVIKDGIPTFEEYAQQYAEKYPSAIEGQKGAVESASSSLSSTAKSNLEFDATNEGAHGASLFGDGVLSKKEYVRQQMEKVRLETEAEARKTNLYNAGADMIAGLKRGIQSGQPGLTSTVSSVVGGIGKTTRKVAQIESPSKMMAKLGRYFPQGLAVGMDDEAKVVEKATERMLDPLTNADVSMSLKGMQSQSMAAMAIPAVSADLLTQADKVPREDSLSISGFDFDLLGKVIRENIKTATAEEIASAVEKANLYVRPSEMAQSQAAYSDKILGSRSQLVGRGVATR